MLPSKLLTFVSLTLVVACGPGMADADMAEGKLGQSDEALVTPMLTRHTIGSFSGVAHFGADSVPTDDAFVPPATALSASGKRPATSILWNWTGNTDSPAGPGAYSTGAHRNEKAIGGSYVEGGIYWLDFWVYFDPKTTNSNVVDWNYIVQHRSNGGAAPSPSPCIGILGNNLILRRNISGYGSAYDTIGGLDEGGLWHHYEVGYRWSVSATTGWVEVWRDNVNVLPRKAVRTAYDTASGATLRFGGGYRTRSITGPVKYWLYGLEVLSARATPSSTPTPTPAPTPPQSDPQTPSPDPTLPPTQTPAPPTPNPPDSAATSADENAPRNQGCQASPAAMVLLALLTVAIGNRRMRSSQISAPV